MQEAPHSPGESSKGGRGGSASYREDLKQLELRDVKPLLPSIHGHGHRGVLQVLGKQRDEEDGPRTETTPDLVSWGPVLSQGAGR